MGYQSELAAVIDRHSQQQGLTITSIPGLKLFRTDTPSPRMPVIYEPAICVVAQGRKQLYYGDRSFSYDPNHYLINSLTLPIEAEIQEVGPGQPYLGLALRVDRTIVNQLMLEMDRIEPPQQTTEASDIIKATAITDRLQDCFIRLVESINNPMEQQILGPGMQREIFYEVLKGPHGDLMRNSISNHLGANRIAPVVHYIEEHFHQPLDIDTLARFAGMSSSSLHEYFKQATAMSPMQFVKNLRLHRARTLLLSGNQASEASYQVGYSSPSQFSREFKRFFGDSPREVLAAAVR
ncbi:MAG: AraC family transcriptional regulator [Motiliproteus sp.]|nr:AraC family transcriptional regulator [Motiliproteus sp.]MCW9054011.1 AraC family transcriptional regulator [Motiliproteus sp.]